LREAPPSRKITVVKTLQTSDNAVKNTAHSAHVILGGYVVDDISADYAPEFLKQLYHLFFDREPDEEGFRTYMTELEAGAHPHDVVAALLQSDEFRTKWRQKMETDEKGRQPEQREGVGEGTPDRLIGLGAQQPAALATAREEDAPAGQTGEER
jgi:Domain of unknown function (DUF4214)